MSGPMTRARRRALEATPTQAPDAGPTAASEPSRPQSRHQPALCLPAEMYPHLIDLIFAHADTRALLRLRLASRTWRQRADTNLSPHLALAKNKVYAVDAGGDMVLHPAFAPSPPDVRPRQQARRRPIVPVEPPPPPSCTGETRIIDCMDRVPLSEDASRLIKSLGDTGPFLRTWENCRERPRLGITADADTIVHFTWAPPLDPLTDVPAGTQAGATDIVTKIQAWAPIRAVEGGTRKLVVNISTTTHPFPTGRRSFLPFSTYPVEDKGTLQEVVVVVNHPNSSDKAEDFLNSWVRLLDALRVASASPVPFTFVNTSAVPQRSLRALMSHAVSSMWRWRYPASTAAFRTAPSFQEAAEVYIAEDRALNIQSVHGVGRGWHLMDRIKFVSAEEYAARVGAERFRIETMERP